MIIKIKYQTYKRYNMKKNRDKRLQKQNDRYVHFKDLVRSYVELENRLIAMEENLKSFLKK